MGTGTSENAEFVVLLHGILRSLDMLPLTLYLQRKGYNAANIMYHPRDHNLESLVDDIDAKIRSSKNYSDDKKLHFVTNSMGGLIARYYIAARKPKNLGRVVMLCPPNTGSEHADFLVNNRHLSGLSRKMLGPALDQLVTTYKHPENEITYPLGIIAGSVSINPLALIALPKKNVGPHDGMVPVERTKIAGMKDHIVVPSTHTFMMFNPGVMRQVANFLKDEQFKRK
jgi:pimeloyl-ACP methyl ester carboxylesterase